MTNDRDMRLICARWAIFCKRPKISRVPCAPKHWRERVAFAGHDFEHVREFAFDNQKPLLSNAAVSDNCLIFTGVAASILDWSLFFDSVANSPGQSLAAGKAIDTTILQPKLISALKD